MFCYNCGKQIPGGVKFCHHCGASQAIVNGGSANGTHPRTDIRSSEYHYSYVRQQPQAQQPQQPPVQQPQQPPVQQPQQPPVQQPQQPRVQQPQQTQVQQPQQTPVQQPQQPPVQQPQQTSVPTSQRCVYKVAMESDFKKFEFGGMPEGNVDIYDDRLEFFKKSKMVSLAFGAIGSALNGKGKEDITIYRNMVRYDTISAEKNIFRFSLTDGRLVYIQLLGFSSQDACNALRRFLNV